MRKITTLALSFLFIVGLFLALTTSSQDDSQALLSAKPKIRKPSSLSERIESEQLLPEEEIDRYQPSKKASRFPERDELLAGIEVNHHEVQYQLDEGLKAGKIKPEELEAHRRLIAAKNLEDQHWSVAEQLSQRLDAN